MVNGNIKKYHTLSNFSGRIKYARLTVEEVKRNREMIGDGFFIVCCHAGGFLDHAALMEREIQNAAVNGLIMKFVVLTFKDYGDDWPR